MTDVGVVRDAAVGEAAAVVVDRWVQGRDRGAGLYRDLTRACGEHSLTAEQAPE